MQCLTEPGVPLGLGCLASKPQESSGLCLLSAKIPDARVPPTPTPEDFRSSCLGGISPAPQEERKTRTYFSISEKKYISLTAKLIVIILWPNIRRFTRTMSPFSCSVFRALGYIGVCRADVVGDVEKSNRETTTRNYSLVWSGFSQVLNLHLGLHHHGLVFCTEWKGHTLCLLQPLTQMCMSTCTASAVGVWQHSYQEIVPQLINYKSDWMLKAVLMAPAKQKQWQMGPCWSLRLPAETVKTAREDSSFSDGSVVLVNRHSRFTREESRFII